MNAPLEATRARIEWGLQRFPGLAIATGLNVSGTVLIDLAVKAGFVGEVLFVDTGYHFPETVDLWHTLGARYGQAQFVTLHGQNEADALYERDPQLCCALNKVAPLYDHLASRGVPALINGRTRESATTRATLQEVEDGTPTRINPLIAWSREELEAYRKEFELPAHPLYEDGFLSMGCWPCTRAVKPGEDPRAGRFEGQARTECGIWTSQPSPDGGATEQVPIRPVAAGAAQHITGTGE